MCTYKECVGKFGSFCLFKEVWKSISREKKQNLEEAEKKAILVNIKDLTLCQAGNVLINNTDSILISSLINTLTSGCYSNYYFVSAGVLGVAGSFFESIIAKVGSLSHILMAQPGLDFFVRRLFV